MVEPSLSNLTNKKIKVDFLQVVKIKQIEFAWNKKEAIEENIHKYMREEE